MSRHANDSILAWMDAVRRGDEEAANVLWERYFPDVLRLARRRLDGQPLGREGPEHVAMSVVNSILKAIKLGRFPDLQHRDELWRLLCLITRRKAADVIRYNARRREVGESHLGQAGDASTPGAFDRIADTAPALAAASMEEVRRLLDLLNERERRAVELRLAGHTVKEISQQCGRGVSTIELYLKSARDKWTGALRAS